MSTIELEDSYFTVFKSIQKDTVKNLVESRNRQFYEEPIDKDLPIKERSYGKLYLRQDSVKRLYEREVETLASFFGDIGGILGVITALGTFLTEVLVRRSMMSEMVRDTYQVQSYRKD